MNDYSEEDRRRGRRHRRRHRSGGAQFRHYQERKRHGWGMGLYRNRRDGKICGVAAGIADYWDVADWVVRLIFIGAFLFTGTLAIWAYVAGCLLLSPRPDDRKGRRRKRESAEVSGAVPPSANEEAFGPEMEYDERYHDYRPKKMFRYSDSASVRLSRARERLDQALRRVEDMETYVTSRRFKLNSEISRL
ncbi:PspC domain-containing protein [Congregibacter litoralis]|uniref:Phage shock protein C (PspC) family protein n=1 Tax=Congregibacter litoralis KT71 TaxID=314285 RepID=A4A3R0_9GAMM|nr:PspC domain-containing protein [Congregibacter litoralis]EAQ99333.1 phage shock protein C (PspC) family protein [Congregibacter litoralis KT71]